MSSLCKCMNEFLQEPHIAHKTQKGLLILYVTDDVLGNLDNYDSNSNIFLFFLIKCSSYSSFRQGVYLNGV